MKTEISLLVSQDQQVALNNAVSYFSRSESEQDQLTFCYLNQLKSNIEKEVAEAQYNYYLVKLRLRTGDIEKESVQAIKAKSYLEAQEIALIAECHSVCNDGAEWEVKGESISDLYGEWIYSVNSCKKIDKNLFDLIQLNSIV
ncbi:hypothetical protein [Pseudoalteromonas phage J2-1_QLiu-2017]|nr:hypothetical protein [Pseudoalteromonas phage J2-1_QLiu-2017]